MRLCNSALHQLSLSIRRPAYDRNLVTPGIVHLGIGAFHRAHQAVYMDDILARGDMSWGIIGASLRSPDTRDALERQNGLYTLVTRSAAGTDYRVIGAVLKVRVATDALEPLFGAMVDPRVRIVSLTVTEKGYCHDPATGELLESHPDIVHDHAHPHAPRSAVGVVVEALARRREAGHDPFTVLCCDNLPHNGATVKRVLSRFAQLRGPALGAYVDQRVACPSTMVDRIVPATTDADRAMVREALGFEDAWPVMAEPFTQWVIEDVFPTGRPDLAAVGAELVSDVKPYELMKLRLLNGAHSTIAYLGYLCGYETVAEAVADPGMAALVKGLMDEEATPTLPPLPGFDLAHYRAQLLARFANPALKHRTWQIAMDGSQKLPQRLLNTARDRLAAGASIDRIALAVAAWMHYVTGVDGQGRAIDVRDPLAQRLRQIADEAGPVAERLAPALLRMREVFGDDLPADPRFTGPVTAALARLYAEGARKVVAAFGGRP